MIQMYLRSILIKFGMANLIIQYFSYQLLIVKPSQFAGNCEGFIYGGDAREGWSPFHRCEMLQGVKRRMRDLCTTGCVSWRKGSTSSTTSRGKLRMNARLAAALAWGWHYTQAAHAGAFMRHRHSQARRIYWEDILFWQLTQPVVQKSPLRGSHEASFSLLTWMHYCVSWKSGKVLQ